MAAGMDGTPPAALLDIGCGTGRLLRRAAVRWPTASLVGVDPADGMIDAARRLTPDATFHRGQGESLPLGDACVDAAFSTISFHHWADQAGGLREVRRVLRPGGRFCLVDIALPGFTAPLIPHARIHTRREMAALFAGAGFVVETQRGLFGGLVAATVGLKG